MSKINSIIDDLDEVCEMARICKLPNKIEIFVNTDDGWNIPHFHVWKKTSCRNHEWETCIKFDSPEYFLHGKYSDKISTKIAKEIDFALRSVDLSDRFKRTFWEIAIDEWNRNNSSKDLPLELEQPDYTKLNK